MKSLSDGPNMEKFGEADKNYKGNRMGGIKATGASFGDNVDP